MSRETSLSPGARVPHWMQRAVGVLLVSTATIPCTARVRPPEGPWNEVVSNHFVVLGNDYEAHLEEAARLLEAFGALMVAEGFPGNRDEGLPTEVFAFKDERSFAAVLGKTRSRGWYRTGTIGWRDGVPTIAVNLGSSNPWETLFHEAVHDAVGRRYPNAPRWLNEGYAQTYSMIRLASDSASISVNDDALDDVVYGPKISLEGLFSTPPTTEDPKLLSRIYNWSWAFVYYLSIAKPENEAKLARFADLLNKRHPVKDAFTDALGCSYDSLEKEMMAYFTSDEERSKRIPRRRVVIPTVGHARPVREGDVLLRLANALVGVDPDRTALARRYLRAVSATVGPSPALAAASAQVLAMEDELEAADRAFERAIDAGAVDPRTLVRSAWNVLRMILATKGSDTAKAGQFKARVDRARGRLNGLVEAHPALGAAWYTLGWTYVYRDGEAVAGVRALERADALAPLDAESLKLLVWLLLRSGDKAAAARVIDERLEPLGRPALVAEARLLLENFKAEKP